MFQLTKKTAIVTGGSSGIGRAISEVLAEAGAHVFLCGRNTEAGEAVAAGIRERGGLADFGHVDVGSAEEVAAFVERAGQATGRIDILCNNASYTTGAQHDVTGSTEEEWAQNIRVGLLGMQYCTYGVIPWMTRQGGGSIINISSIQALVGCPTSTAYTTVKAGQLGFTRSAAYDYGVDNIRVNAVCPGPIQVWYSPKPGDPAYEYQVRNTLLRRVAQPREVACAVLYLASDEASFVTGAILPVDGGWTAQ